MDKVFNLQTGEKLRIGTDSHCHPEAADASPECNGVVQSNGDIKISFNGSKCSPKVTVSIHLVCTGVSFRFSLNVGGTLGGKRKLFDRQLLMGLATASKGDSGAFKIRQLVQRSLPMRNGGPHIKQVDTVLTSAVVFLLTGE